MSQATVSSWVSGKRVPDPDQRDLLRRAFDIPLSAWPGVWNDALQRIVDKLAERDPDLLAELAEDLNSLL
ncbi:hypothetical protein AKJ09_09845 [Labilithrix luteola]|uniref:HTH cro/C1-type domain-containing protein n=1 Tax=Labilithrix luteola TaxID=1391654 RepID=A0A0K1QBY0_9BACT|nr:hypothetical protein AKJ09_09845 [Labilithrix luteola]